MTPNGVEVRGLRVVRSFEGHRIRWWLKAIDGLDAFPGAYRGSVLTVSSDHGEVLARRRFKRNRDTEKARRHFVDLVTEMSDDAHATADWQALLDSV